LWDNFRLSIVVYGRDHDQDLPERGALVAHEAILILVFLLEIVSVNMLLSLGLRLILVLNLFLTLWLNTAVFLIGSPIKLRARVIAMLLLNSVIVFTTYGSWKQEMHVREKWKDAEDAQSEVTKAAARSQAMLELIRMICEVDFVASEDLTICNDISQGGGLLGDISGKKLCSLVAPESIDTFNSLIAPVIDGSSTIRSLMTPPLTLQSTSSISTHSGCTSVRASIVMVDTGELHVLGETTWKYLIGIKDLQHVNIEADNVEVPYSSWEDKEGRAILDEHDMHASNTTPQQETASTCTGRVFTALDGSQAASHGSTQGRHLWQTLVDLGIREHWLIPAEDIVS